MYVCAICCMWRRVAPEEAGAGNGADRAKRIVAAGIHGIMLATIARSRARPAPLADAFDVGPSPTSLYCGPLRPSGILTLAISHALAGRHCLRCFPCAPVGRAGQTWPAFIEHDLDLDTGCGLGQAKIAGPDASASKHTSAGDDSISCSSSCLNRVCISCFDLLHTAAAATSPERSVLRGQSKATATGTRL